MIRLAHEVPGRLRLQAPSLVGHARRAAWVRSRLRQLPGVIAAHPNVVTGSIVVTYSRDRATRDAVLLRLRECGLEQQPAQPPSVPRKRPSDVVVGPLGEKFVSIVADYLAERAAHALLAAII